MHGIFERFYKGSLDFFDACIEYEDQYANNVTIKFPYNAYVNLNKTYYQAGLDALEKIDKLIDGFEVLDVECKIQTKVRDTNFVGYADLILRDKHTQKIAVVDHKSKSRFSSKAERKKYTRQLYLYSLYVKEKYGEFPSQLIFNMFRTGELEKIPFDERDLNETIEWFLDSVANIYMELDFEDTIKERFESIGKPLSAFAQNDFFCNELCGVRNYCPRSKCYEEE